MTVSTIIMSLLVPMNQDQSDCLQAFSSLSFFDDFSLLLDVEFEHWDAATDASCKWQTTNIYNLFYHNWYM